MSRIPVTAAALLALLATETLHRSARAGTLATADAVPAPSLYLERVVDPRSSSRGRAFLHRLTGEDARPALERPFGVAWSGEDLLVTDPGAARVLRIDARGRVTASSAPSAFSVPIGVADCPAGPIVTDALVGGVALLDRSLRVRSWLATALERPTGVACDGDRVFVVETGRHQILTLSGTEPPRVLGRRGQGLGEFNYPSAIALDAGKLWVGDTLNFRVQLLDPSSGSALAVFGRNGDAPGDMPRLKGLAVDSRGRLWVSDAHLDRVCLFGADGTFLYELGGPDGADIHLAFPSGLAAKADGRLAVADALNRRILVFRLGAPAGDAGAGASP